MSTLILIRPGLTDFDEQHRIQGTLDLPLNSRGEQQVQEMTAELRNIPLEVIYTSPCEPARSTAEMIGMQLGVNVKELDGLRNVHQGLWEGLNVDEIRRKHPKVFKQWQESPATVCAPEGEMLSEAWNRVKEALERPLKKKKDMAIVAPEPVASLVRCIVLGKTTEGFNPLCDGETRRIWEFLQSNGVAPADSPNVPPAQAASRQN